MESNELSNKETRLPSILAVAASSTENTYSCLAEENLKKAAELAGVTIKVETRTSTEIKNELSAFEINTACAIIVPSDAKIPMERFNGCRVLKCTTADEIHRSDELIKKVRNGEAKFFTVPPKKSESEKQSKIAVPKMLPLVVGGGILIALALLIF